jgi:hypothetical protein
MREVFTSNHLFLVSTSLRSSSLLSSKQPIDQVVMESWDGNCFSKSQWLYESSLIFLDHQMGLRGGKRGERKRISSLREMSVATPSTSKQGDPWSIMPELSETFKRLKDDPQAGSQHLLTLLESFLQPFLHILEEALDKRLVRTFLQCLVAIIRGRNNAQVLWLSELGSYLDGYGAEVCSAAAGTKRVGKLLRSVKWTPDLIERYLLEKADEEVQKLKELQQRILCIWDDSVVEKAESEKGEGLGPVLSSKAKRRGRTKRGVVFNWPAPRPVRVIGMQWTAAVIVGMQGFPHLALSRWWTTKGVFATRLRDTQEEEFRVCFRKWGPLLVHLFDRGYASGYWLTILLKYRARFIIRWIGKHVFLTLAGQEKKLWEIGRGKHYLAHKAI